MALQSKLFRGDPKLEAAALQDFAYRDRTGEPDPQKYINLPAQFAINNADSYGYFALQMAKGIDRVLSKDE